MTTLTELKALLDLTKDYPNANVVVTVTIGSTPSNGGGDGGGTYRYKVVTGDKPNNQVKVRAAADMGDSQIGFVYDGDIVTGDGRVVGVFTHIVTPFPGFVETMYLLPL